ncbi:MAG: archease [Nanoarchaeota archaeon]
MQKFKILHNLSWADIAFEAYGKSYNELFNNAAEATFAQMVDLKTVKPKEKKTITLSSETIQGLLFDFLSELIYMKDTFYMLFSKFDSKVKESKGKFELKTSVSGEEINPKRHRFGVDVKAVTMHRFNIEKIKNIYKATVILDV